MKQGMIRRRKERNNDLGDSLVCKYLHGSFSTYRLFFLDLSNSAQYLHWALSKKNIYISSLGHLVGADFVSKSIQVSLPKAQSSWFLEKKNNMAQSRFHTLYKTGHCETHMG